MALGSCCIDQLADDPRHNDPDGIGNLSEDALVQFRQFFPATCVDQTHSMRSILEPAVLLRRMEIYVGEEVLAGQLPNGSFPLMVAERTMVFCSLSGKFELKASISFRGLLVPAVTLSGATRRLLH